jgi:protein-S-isoprenylcysteine O-methyltransferase Ste14
MGQENHPGVYIPPPLIYVLFFLMAKLLQKKISLNDQLLHQTAERIAGGCFLTVACFLIFLSLRQFLQSRNTVITIKPANSLQKDGIYNFTRNPMYVGLAFVYLGLTVFIGNWWNLIVFPLLLIIVQEYIIRREENYLEKRFGQEYLEYKSKVRRWL